MLFSVIIPVYNSSAWLDCCLDSVIRASDTLCSGHCETGINESVADINRLVTNSAEIKNNVQIVCVNDGSTDGSDVILERYKGREYHNCIIEIIHQKNSGVSVARNVGIANAIGDWILFLDSDDWISDDYLRKVRKHIENDTELDLIATTVELVYDENRYVNVRAGLAQKNFAGDLLAQTHRNAYMSLRSSFCDLVIRGELIRKNRICFPGTMRIAEDSLFAETVFAYAKRMIFDPDIKSYYYRQDKGNTSLSHQVTINDIKSSLYRVLENIRLFTQLGSWGTRLNACHCALGMIMAIRNDKVSDRNEYITWLVNNKQFKEIVLPFLAKKGISFKSRFFAFILRKLPRILQKVIISLLVR